ncbi:putative metal-binding protein [Anaerosolibacter carboniphilus]|uniref:Putative metal-binding protein n=1 Tax=Anaerosolibacter carboniphilus TaxID=1417629 RepID=A0A841KP17_9FIRM|nr:CGGC domain-containing protein [Anaerosolibacter carboniphilus]MBB6215534.1 putative metal-binding protein [Anaerosolibacter carboniphilus]
MEKIGIINCFEVSQRCSGGGCTRAFHHRTGAFEAYDQEDEMISFVHCNGCGEESVQQVLNRAKEMKEAGVTAIHLSTCVRAKCPWYDQFMSELSKDFNVEGYSHGKKR